MGDQTENTNNLAGKIKYEKKMPRAEKRFHGRMKKKRAVVVAEFSIWSDNFHNQFAHALFKRDWDVNTSFNVFGLFDRYWRLYTQAWNKKAREYMRLKKAITLFDLEYFTATHIDNNPNSLINKQAA